MKLFSFRRRHNVAIDFGNNNIIITDQNNKLWSQPSYVTLDTHSKAVRAVGKHAYDMLGKVPPSLKVINPMRGGVIADFNAASKMLNALIKKAYPARTIFSSFNYIVSGIPYATTEVERRALRDTLEQFSSSNIFLIFEPIAAALGIGLDIREPDGKFLVDIGGGITEAVVISLSGIVNYRSIKTGGDTFDDDIQKHFKKNHNIDIGLHMAEQIKIKVGAALESIEDEPEPFHVMGKDAVTGIPKGLMVDHKEIAYVLNNTLLKIEQAIIQTLEECPPELASDIYENGVYITGGSAMLRGLRDRIEAKVKIPVYQDPDALYAVANGINVVLKSPETYKPVLFR